MQNHKNMTNDKQNEYQWKTKYSTLTIVSKYGTGTPHKTINKQINFTKFD